MSDARWDTLPCGNDPERLLNLAAERTPIGPGSHEATCGYCQAALAEFRELWQPVRQWAQQDVALPRGFLAAIVNRVRKLAQSPHHVAATGAKGATTVTSWVLGLIASAASIDTPGVKSLSSHAAGMARPGQPRRRNIRDGADGVDITEVDASAVSVAFGINASSSTSVVEVADRVRRNVIRAIALSTDIEVTEVDIGVDDIDGPADPESGRTRA